MLRQAQHDTALKICLSRKLKEDEKFRSYLSGFGTCSAMLRNGCQDVNGPVPRSFLISNESKSSANISANSENKNRCLHSRLHEISIVPIKSIN
jgi:hypothetical protein